MSLLTAFETSARHQSFTAAAAELNLTQSAVSRQIRALEDIVGSELFHRERQTVTLTLAGERYAREIRKGLKCVADATLGFRANPTGESLSLAVLPTFAMRWLTPRLSVFLADNPGLSVNLISRLAPFDFSLDTVDAAIHFGVQDWPHARMDYLMRETVVAACSPSLLSRFSFAKPGDLLDAPLLHLTSRPDAWERWFAINGAPTDDVHGMLFDQFAMVAQAAVDGLGIALLPSLLIEKELRNGELVVAFDSQVVSTDAYYFVQPSALGRHPTLDRFRDWLLAEACTFRSTSTAG